MILNILQIIICVSLIALILMQSSGSGLGSAWGGSGQSFHSRRGVEQTIFKLTILLVVVFVGVSLLPLIGISF